MRKETKKTTRRDLPFGRLKEVADFLPPPEKLVAAGEMVKVTIAFDRESLEFFKKKAAKHGTKYQKMIREVIRGYASRWA